MYNIYIYIIYTYIHICIRQKDRQCDFQAISDLLMVLW